MRQVPDPERGEWIERMRERARLDAEELVPRPPFGVFGLAAPRLRPSALAEAGRVDGAWETVALAYGDWAAPAGPWVTVTSTARADVPGLADEADLIGVIDRERDRIADHAGVDEEEPPEPPGYSRSDLPVGDRSVSALVCRHGTVWAAGLLAGGGVRVTIAGRGVNPGSVRLAPVADLGPYLRGRGEMLARLAGHHRRQPPPVLEPAEGLAAYRALADAALAAQARDLAVRRAGRVPRYRAAEGATMGALWQRAVSEQQRLSGIGGRQADEVVTSVVNHLTHLQEQARWFTAEPGLHETAIDETLRHAVLGEDVPSGQAQQAWGRYWAHHLSLVGLVEPGAALRAELQAAGALTAGWLQAWAAWTRG